ncbi:MAG: ferrous iron transport protein A [Hellea sp.]|nr:ferrous iron transport protein A [Hellea sp.]
MTLRDLQKGCTARVTGFHYDDDELETRLREIGFAEGDEVELMHVGLFGQNPITVKLNGALIAMRKNEAGVVIIENPIT